MLPGRVLPWQALLLSLQPCSRAWAIPTLVPTACSLQHGKPACPCLLGSSKALRSMVAGRGLLCQQNSSQWAGEMPTQHTRAGQVARILQQSCCAMEQKVEKDFSLGLCDSCEGVKCLRNAFGKAAWQIPGAEGIPWLALESREESRAALAGCVECLVVQCSSAVWVFLSLCVGLIQVLCGFN